jgi:cytochrome c oxidase subunit 2
VNGFSLWPVAASAQAGRVDLIFAALLALAGAIMLLVVTLLLVFAIRYRRGSPTPRGSLPEILKREVELGWTSATLFLALFLFWWAGATQLSATTPPPGALEIHVDAKQWMWKTRHPSGAREINALHVPVDRPVRLVMTSQDVIHSFFVPAFRLKQDVVPGRLTQTWFKATRLGTYRLFCAEFCGTDHAVMGGAVTVMRPEDYAAWTRAQPQGDDLARQGGVLFQSLGCSGCHASASPIHAPDLHGIFGRIVHLAGGRTVQADEAYLRDSILQPKRDVVAGFEPIMPSFAGQLSEGELQELVAYLMSLREAE